MVRFSRMRHYENTEPQLTLDQSVIMSLPPLKESLLTIPKLELQAALIAARMKEIVLHEISFHPRAIFL